MQHGQVKRRRIGTGENSIVRHRATIGTALRPHPARSAPASSARPRCGIAKHGRCGYVETIIMRSDESEPVNTVPRGSEYIAGHRLGASGLDDRDQYASELNGRAVLQHDAPPLRLRCNDGS